MKPCWLPNKVRGEQQLPTYCSVLPADHHTHIYAPALKIDPFKFWDKVYFSWAEIQPEWARELGFEAKLKLLPRQPSNCVSQNLRQNLFLFVANEESSRSLQGLRSVTALGLGSEGPRLNICFTWFYTPITHSPPTVQCALDLQLESAWAEAKPTFSLYLTLFVSLTCFENYSFSNSFIRMFSFCLTCLIFGQIADLTNCSCCLTYLTMYLINRRRCSRLLWDGPGAAWQ